MSISKCGRNNIRFPDGSIDKESTCNTGDTGSIPGMGRFTGGGNGNPLQYSCLKNLVDKKSLVGYSLWGHKESDTTEHAYAELKAPPNGKW